MKNRKSYDAVNNEKLVKRCRRIINRFSDLRDVKAISKLSYDESYVVSKYHLIHELVKIGKPAIPGLLESIRNKNHLVRELVVRALGEIGDATITPALIKMLKRDDRRRVQLGTIRALQKIIGVSFSAQKRTSGNAQQREVVNKWLNWWKENKTYYKNSKNRQPVSV
ncbi:MAG: HEAT repeat domain-containing protein [Planctomycetota bacterium]|nr:MAG: HEAT repeat domain-containing protein [Planctomycetota bacterium]